MLFTCEFCIWNVVVRIWYTESISIENRQWLQRLQLIEVIFTFELYQNFCVQVWKPILSFNSALSKIILA